MPDESTDVRLARIEEKLAAVAANVTDIKDNHLASQSREIERMRDRISLVLIVTILTAAAAGANIGLRLLGA